MNYFINTFNTYMFVNKWKFEHICEKYVFLNHLYTLCPHIKVLIHSGEELVLWPDLNVFA